MRQINSVLKKKWNNSQKRKKMKSTKNPGRFWVLFEASRALLGAFSGLGRLVPGVSVLVDQALGRKHGVISVSGKKEPRFQS